MCGIAGFIAKRALSAETLPAMAAAMIDPLTHRGPDDSGVWSDPSVGVALGFRRLSILDLSAEGHQPMRSASGRYVIIYNGEIYNYLDLRDELAGQGHRFRGHSDTEVMLRCFDEFGVDATVQKLNGMFAFALWDRTEQTLTLARDRAGEKPLYYGWLSPDVFAFASELKAMQQHPSFHADVDRAAVALYLQFGYVPAPYSIFTGIRKIRPGTLVSVSTRSSDVRERAYWSFFDVAAPERRDAISEADAIEQFDALLEDSVKRRMIADVPLGAFLSGGVDSSVVVGAMQAQSPRPVRTFTIGFPGTNYDEAPYAAAVARHLGTDHTEMNVTPGDAIGVIPDLPRIYDEPFSDSSQIPTLLMARLARQHVTVALSGDGGDELFGGYSRYPRAQTVWRSLQAVPRPLKRAAAFAIDRFSYDAWDSGLSGEHALSRLLLARGLSADRLMKTRDMLRMDGGAAVCRDMVTHWRTSDRLVRATGASRTMFDETAVNLPDFVETSMLLDSITYLPDDILVKLDRATMAVSLEGRVPLLDHRIIEFAWRLPVTLKIRGNTTKWIVRRVLERYVPQQLIDRPKHGFGVPIDLWLRRELRDWAESYLSEKRLRDDGLFDAALVVRKWKQHVSGVCNWKPLLWDVLMLQAWYEAQKRRPAAVADSDHIQRVQQAIG